jgi:hypothetical protein
MNLNTASKINATERSAIEVNRASKSKNKNLIFDHFLSEEGIRVGRYVPIQLSAVPVCKN